ncbi:uncharacterized protein MELLADRAFT_52478 [Melampsora larici-populina 98AG31]|uniref:Alpha-ketoglutarate-dependent dioxygenase AlkB-like domain-containing protein n=1 Tax=Melampsora larici-populina (strain 98AG31 / pathotype 3-4-7) TaxID=747676 RepID=F4RKH7_MELLP|nr:uncharacterized protein MELLADRAFT_52478 [Melampsora larici-populina 98AG31]EGG07097.1 hypothetical protein MELLADRAFT_52478 [Melampsora larici-populina 98AG31]
MEEFNKRAPRLFGYALSNTFNKILSCCYLPGTGMNMSFGPLVASLGLGSAAIMSFKPKSIKVKTEKLSDQTSSEQPHGGETPDTKPTSAKTAMTLLFKHSDIVLQVGPGLQRDWLHAETNGFRIAATACNIRSDILKP